MADYPIPKNGVAYILYTGLVSQSDTKLLKANPTLAAGDFKVSIDGGAFNNLTTLPTVTPASGTSVKISLSAAEMTGDNIVVTCIDAAGAEWCDQLITIQTAARGVADLAYPATSGRSMVVDAAGLVDANMVKLGPTGSGTAQTARDLGLAIPAAVAGAAGGLFIAGTNAATTISGLTTGALSATTITASGAVAFQSTFAVTTSTALAALSCSTLTASGAVAFQSTFAVTTSTALAALSCSTLTASGAVALQSTLIVTGSTTFTGAITGTNAANDLRINGIVPGAANGLFIAGTNAATVITTSLTTHFVGTIDTLTTYTGNTPQTGDVFPLASTEIADIKAKTDLIPAAPASTTNITAASGVALSATGADLVLIDGVAFRSAMQYIAAITAGKITGAGTGTEVFKGIDGSTTRVTVTVDASGNRSVMTLVP